MIDQVVYNILSAFLANNTTCWPKVNLFGIWQIQKLEQVHLVLVPTLPASKTINQTFKKHDLLKKTENLHAASELKVYTSDPKKDIFEKVYTSDPKKWYVRESLHFWLKKWYVRKVYTSDPQNDIFEKVYTSDPQNDIFEKVYTSD